MDEKDLKIVVDIIKTADGGCLYCVQDLLVSLRENYPQYKDLINKEMEETRGEHTKIY